MNKRSFMRGAIILMIAGFVTRILGFVYRVYLSNLIGAEGMGLFQLIFPVYSLIILTLTSGISIAVSRMVAEELAKNHIINLRRITSVAFTMVVGAGLLISAFMFVKIDFFVDVILKDSRTYYSLLLLIPCIPVIAAASAIKGYFYGTQDTVPTAASQIVEQVVRIGLVMIAASWVLNRGVEYASTVAIFGMAMGEIANLLVVYTIYKLKRKKVRENDIGLMRKRKIVRNLLAISLPISLNRLITSTLFAVETILIPWRFLAGGVDYQQSLEIFGKLTGMAMPVIFFPSLITSSLATTLVPAVSESVSLGNYRIAVYRVSKSIQITMAIGFIFTAIFLSYPDQIANAIYRRQNIGPMLFALAFTGIFIYLQQTLLGILNGLGKQGISLINSMVGYSIRIGFVYFAIPLYGVDGYVWGMIASSVVVCMLNIATVMMTVKMRFEFENWLVKPGAIGLALICTSKYIYSFCEIFYSSKTWVIFFTLMINFIFAAALMMMTGIIKKNEIARVLGLKGRKYIDI